MQTRRVAEPKFYDELEFRNPYQRERDLTRALQLTLNHARSNSRAWAQILKSVDANAIQGMADLGKLPLLTRAELYKRQKAARAGGGDFYGGFAIGNWGELSSIFSLPGPLYVPGRITSNYWRLARALYAAGVRPGQLVHNAHAYHAGPFGAMFDGAARSVGCVVFPAGDTNTEQQVGVLRDLRPTVFLGEAASLRGLLEQSQELPLNARSLRLAVLNGAPLDAAQRQWLSERGVQAFQCYARAETGLIAYESEAHDGLILDEEIMAEIVLPGSAYAAAEGETGELVVTTFNQHFPLFRFATGDLARLLPGVSACGRSNRRIQPWLGNAEQSAKFKGTVLRATHVAELRQRVAGLTRARLVISQQGEQEHLQLRLEAEPTAAAQAETLRQQCTAILLELIKHKADVELLAPGTLANDGLLLEDQRTH